MATFVIGDMHNSLNKFEKLLEMIQPKMRDHICLLGDVFDRGGAEPDPVGVYFKISGLEANVTWIRGNHDQLLADYIYGYYGTPEKKREGLQPYSYNSFNLMKERLVEADMLNLADKIMRLPLQVELEIDSKKYLLAHAMTVNPAYGERRAEVYLEGMSTMDEYWSKGVDGYISLIGHYNSSYQSGNPYGNYLDEKSASIWKNNPGNLYLLDCGCGLPGGRLACLCLETGERFYS